MSIAEKKLIASANSVIIAENEQKVYEAGKKAEYDSFWDVFQNKGNSRIYYYAFSNNRFNDTNFNPKYPLNCSTANTAAQHMFSSNITITDTKVPIIVNGSNANAIFYGATKLKIVRELQLTNANTSVSSMFANCESLENITITGTGKIASACDISDSSKLSSASVDSIIEHLKDLTGATALKLTLNSTVGNKLTEDQKASITAKNWTLVY